MIVTSSYPPSPPYLNGVVPTLTTPSGILYLQWQTGLRSLQPQAGDHAPLCLWCIGIGKTPNKKIAAPPVASLPETNYVKCWFPSNRVSGSGNTSIPKPTTSRRRHHGMFLQEPKSTPRNVFYLRISKGVQYQTRLMDSKVRRRHHENHNGHRCTGSKQVI